MVTAGAFSSGVCFIPSWRANAICSFNVITLPFCEYKSVRQQLIDTYKAANVPVSDVFAQSFNIEDLDYWIKNEPAYGANAVYLIDDSNHLEALIG